jgi:hypothetical protein
MHVFQAELTWVQPFLCQRVNESGSRSSEGTPHSLSLLSCFLTLEAISRPRYCLQPFQFDFTAALGTLAKVPCAYPFQCVGKPSDSLSCNICLVRERLSFVLRRSLISSVRVPSQSSPVSPPRHSRVPAGLPLLAGRSRGRLRRIRNLSSRRAQDDRDPYNEWDLPLLPDLWRESQI